MNSAEYAAEADWLTHIADDLCPRATENYVLVTAISSLTHAVLSLRPDPTGLERTQSVDETGPAGVWVSYCSDGSMVVPHQSEITAMRAAVRTGYSVIFMLWGESIADAEARERDRAAAARAARGEDAESALPGNPYQRSAVVGRLFPDRL